jgi:hypothetical protein
MNASKWDLRWFSGKGYMSCVGFSRYFGALEGLGNVPI